MSTLIPQCDSDEEVFWGPVTAKEIELVWRYKMDCSSKDEKDKVEDENIDGSTDEIEDLNKTFDVSLSISDTEAVEKKNDFTINEPTLEAFSDENATINPKPITKKNSSFNQLAQYCNMKYLECCDDEKGSNTESPKISLSSVVQDESSTTTKDNVNSEMSNQKGVTLDTNHDAEFKDCDQNKEIYSGNIDVKDDNCESNKYDTSLEIYHTPEKKKSKFSFGTPDTNSIMKHDSDHQPNDEKYLYVSTVEGNITTRESNLKIENTLKETHEKNQNNSNEVNATQTINKICSDESDIKPVEEFTSTGVQGEQENLGNRELPLKSLIESKPDNLKNVTDSFDKKSTVSLQNEAFSTQHVSVSSDYNPDSNGKLNKENQDPSTLHKETDSNKIPDANSSKIPLVRPAKFVPEPSPSNAKWLDDLKKRKVSKLKKPVYMVSPARLESLMKKQVQTISTPQKTPTIPSKLVKTNPSFLKTNTLSSEFQSSTKKKQFEHIRSPVSQYIRTGGTITPSKSLPVLHTSNRIPVSTTLKQTPVRSLNPVYYSSAEKLIIKPGPSGIAPRSIDKKGRTLLAPKIFKHQGRVPDENKPGVIGVVTPRAVRNANMHQMSFAFLPQSPKKLNVSVVEEQF